VTKTVLVVDDEADVQLTLRIVLETAGYRVIEATSGEEALAAVEAQIPDLIVLDLVLPGLTGWETLGQLRARGLASIPVVVVSATGTSGLQSRADELGCCAVFAKPFSAEQLRAKVGAILATTTPPASSNLS
jgi:CheY-like chemotaxis protein